MGDVKSQGCNEMALQYAQDGENRGLDQGRIQTGLTGLYKPVRFSKERKSFTFHGCLLLILGHNSVS